jgi:AcrR family transcriptional regulator
MTGTEDATIGAPGRREQLLQAAREVLAENGYERTTVSSIATKANVAQGTFYLYFPSKEALPGAIATQFAEAMGGAADRAAEQPSLETGLEALVDESFEVGATYGDILLVANRGFELCDDYGGWLTLTAPWRAGLERFLARFQQAGGVAREIDVVTTAIVVRDLVDRAVKARVLFGQDSYAASMVTVLRRALPA